MREILQANIDENIVNCQKMKRYLQAKTCMNEKQMKEHVRFMLKCCIFIR